MEEEEESDLELNTIGVEKEENQRLTRAHGSKGSLHNLLLSSKQCSSPESLRYRNDPLLVAADREKSSFEEPWQHSPRVHFENQLSQSYSHSRGTHLQKLVDSQDMRGELEFLDLQTQEWRKCIGILADGEFTCVPPGTSPSFSLSAQDNSGNFDLEELATQAGGRGEKFARLSLTRVALVATDPQRGPEALRIVVESESRLPEEVTRYGLKPLETDVERRAYSFRAASREAMIEWLFGFQRSLAVVVTRLRHLKRRGTNGGILDARDCDILHKKTSCRRRIGSPGSASPDFFHAGFSTSMTPPSMMPSIDPDEGAALYRKSSARPRLVQIRAKKTKGSIPVPPSTHTVPTAEPAKYIPPHLRRRAQIKEEEDHFEETGHHQGDDEIFLSDIEKKSTQEKADSDEEPTIAADWIRAHGICWRSGSACDRGPRPRNEDACTEVLDLLITSDKQFGFVGVYDGHSGDDAAIKCRTELHLRVREQLERGQNAESALFTAFEEIDATYCQDAARGEASLDAGATALCCLIEAPAVKNKHAFPRLIVANCGDCMCVLGKTDATAVPLSTAHAPTPGGSEARRVEAAGGWITSETDLCVGRLRAMDLDDPEVSERAHERVRLNEIHRVCGEVAVARAIGDVDFKGWPAPNRAAPFFAYPPDHDKTFSDNLLVPTPDLVSRRLALDDAFVLLATDGLWDVIYPAEAIQVASALFAKGAKPNAVANDLCKRALRFGSSDNVTVVVLQLISTSNTNSVEKINTQSQNIETVLTDHLLTSRDSTEPPMPDEPSDLDEFDDAQRYLSASPGVCSDPGGAADFMPFSLGNH